ncbi:unnamed protein product [Strongylus vulgaris]|uniref:Uncharacterized protein n=1 Tax=Strongylus vulgaris TaxID=40348 RepID=A0A3P7JU28_STRVU|nr:unnamed protein product [Strongylus vulgaris]
MLGKEEMNSIVIEDQLARKVIEPVPTDELRNPCDYLSHHSVMKKNDKDLKIRCVYDGSAKIKEGLSPTKPCIADRSSYLTSLESSALDYAKSLSQAT